MTMLTHADIGCCPDSLFWLHELRGRAAEILDAIDCAITLDTLGVSLAGDGGPLGQLTGIVFRQCLAIEGGLRSALERLPVPDQLEPLN